jgi:hypothetical protein
MTRKDEKTTKAPDGAFVVFSFCALPGIHPEPLAKASLQLLQNISVHMISAAE